MRDYAQETDEFKQVTVVVSFKYRHRDVTKATLKEYLRDAIHTWGGQFDPGDNGAAADPLFYGIRSIKIGAIRDGDGDKGSTGVGRKIPGLVRGVRNKRVHGEKAKVART
jgi:hypothetical protein